MSEDIGSEMSLIFLYMLSSSLIGFGVGHMYSAAIGFLTVGGFVLALCLGLMWRLRKKKNKAIIKKGRLGIKPFENISWEAGYYGNRYYEAGKNKSGFFVVRELDRIANKVKVELIDAQGTFLDIWKKIQYYNADAIQWDDETSKDPIDKVKKKLSQEEIIRTPLDELVKKISQEDIEGV